MSASRVATPPASHRVGMFINRDFTLLLFGQTISALGDTIFDFTLLIWMTVDLTRGQTWAPLAVSGLVGAEYVPMLLVRPFAGVFVDRWNRQHILIVADICRAALVLLTLFTAGIVPLPTIAPHGLSLGFRIGALYVLVFLLNTCDQFFTPARTAIIGELVADEQRARASGLEEAFFNLTRVVGPPLAAPLLFTLGVQWGLLLDALSFVVSFVAVAVMRRRFIAADPTTAGNFRKELVEGWRFALGSRFFRTLFGIVALIAIATGPLNTLIVFFVAVNLHANAAVSGYLIAALSIGAIIGSVIAAAVAKKFGLVRFTASALLLFGVSVIALSRATDLIVGAILFGICGIFLGMTSVPFGPMVLHETPRAMIGRVLALIGPITTLGTIISLVSFGVLADALLGVHIHALGTVFGQYDVPLTLAGALFILAGLLTALRLRLS